MTSVSLKERFSSFNGFQNQVHIRVDKVHIDGVCRTKDDVLERAVQELFSVSNSNQISAKANVVRQQLVSLSAFDNIGIYIDTSEGPDATPNGIEVTYHVLESRRIKPVFDALVGNNEGSVAIGAHFPNVFGQGESLQTECQYGTRKSSAFNIALTKPLLGKANPKISANVFQHGADCNWSGYHKIDRGTLIDVLFKTSPDVNHNIQWEGIWRELKCLSTITSFPVREEMGHSLKSSIRHILTVDKRDNPILPNYGTFFRMINEYAGLGGNVGFLKHEMEFQVNQPLEKDMVLQGTLIAGLMRRAGLDKFFCISDRFFLGGPLNLRGFSLSGVGPHSGGNALGAEGYWASALHLYTPIPFRPGKGGIGDFFKIHCFLNAGNIGKFQFSDDYYQSLVMLMTNLRASCGLGIIFAFDKARFELNYCFPLKVQQGDSLSNGLQFGFGVEFL